MVENNNATTCANGSDDDDDGWIDADDVDCLSDDNEIGISNFGCNEGLTMISMVLLIVTMKTVLHPMMTRKKVTNHHTRSTR